MDYETYKQLHGYCWQDLTPIIDRLKMDDTVYLKEIINGDTGGLHHDKQMAMAIYEDKDTTPRQRAAAHLLAVISNHRAITWHREPEPPNGLQPAPQLTQQQHKDLEGQTLNAINSYVAFIPEREADSLVKAYSVNVEVAPIIKSNTKRPIMQQPFQENEILRVISEQGLIATELPQYESGKKGAKAKVRSALNFPINVFDKAWERLRADKRIKEK